MLTLDLNDRFAYPFTSLSMGISEEIKDAKIASEKNEDLKIEAKIWELT